MEENREITNEEVKELVFWLNKENVPYLIIGGQAMMLRFNGRHTGDIDIMLPNDLNVLEQFKNVLRKLPNGNQLANSLDNDPEIVDYVLNSENFRIDNGYLIDIMFNASGNNYQDLVKYAESYDLDGVVYKSVNDKGLLLSKILANRNTDVMDKTFLVQSIKEKYNEFPDKDENGNVIFVNIDEHNENQKNKLIEPIKKLVKKFRR